MEPTGVRYFATPADWRRWLAANHARAAEQWVGFYKRGSGRPSITWPESVDEALCFGWIDGVRKSLDAERYVIRFTPRKPGSIWSAINLRKVKELERAGLMRAAGRAVLAARDPKRARVYSFEQRKELVLSPAHAKRLRGEIAAWAWFSAQAPWYRRTAVFWVVSAKREETRERRLGILIADSAAGLRIGPLRERKGK
jgi:uncharacterized protein YdeI (YjbR/CyaY-like superfamily)